MKFQSAGSGIARIGKERLLVESALLVERIKHLPWHQHLAAHFKFVGIILAAQLQRDGAYCLHVGGYVIPFHAVAASYGARQFPMLIDERNRCAVIFHLADNFKILAAEHLLASRHKFLHLLYRVGVAER